MISKSELVEAIGVRASQIAQNATVFVDINVEGKGGKKATYVDDPVMMAKMEISQRRCPLVLRRTVKTRTDRKTGKITEWVEDWPIRDMVYPSSLKLVG